MLSVEISRSVMTGPWRNLLAYCGRSGAAVKFIASLKGTSCRTNPALSKGRAAEFGNRARRSTDGS